MWIGWREVAALAVAWTAPIGLWVVLLGLVVLSTRYDYRGRHRAVTVKPFSPHPSLGIACLMGLVFAFDRSCFWLLNRREDLQELFRK